MQTEAVIIDDISDKKSQNALKKAGQMIRNGGLVVFPTETVYGLGADATSAQAAEKIYKAKGRPSDNPLIIHIHEPALAEKYTYTTPMFYKIADAFMPGPITVIMKAKDIIPKTVTAGLDTVAVRCPLHPVARELIKKAGVPIAAPSANLSGSPSPTCFKYAYADMNERVDMIIDGGDCDIGLESTIVKIEEDESLTLLRPGAVTVEDLSMLCDDIKISDAVLSALKEGQTVLSPGMKYKHYAPKTPFSLLKGSLEKRFEYVSSQNGRIAVICYDEEVSSFERIIPTELIFNFGKKDDLQKQAKLLFTLLRDVDKTEADAVFAALPDASGIGMALYNRMIRAAGHRIITLN